jgi:hypothetical protein
VANLFSKFQEHRGFGKNEKEKTGEEEEEEEEEENCSCAGHHVDVPPASGQLITR